MNFAYDDYSGEKGIRRFGEIANDFDISANLPRATFPPFFIEPYATQFESEVSEEPEYFVTRYLEGDVTLMLDLILSPDLIHSTNAIVAESLHAPAEAIILPSGHYIFGDAYSDSGQHLLLVDLQPDHTSYGFTYAWHRGHGPLGAGDNKRGLGFVADDLRAFFDALEPREDSR